MASELRPYQDKLKSLYIERDLTLKEVREIMTSEHSIDVGRSSYERLFKEWGLRKTNKGENWGWVSHRMHKRQKRGQSSVLSINDKQIPDEVVRKEISRHVSTLQQAIDQAAMAPSPNTPDGYAITTPGPSSEVATMPSQPTKHSRWPRNYNSWTSSEVATMPSQPTELNPRRHQTFISSVQSRNPQGQAFVFRH